MNSKKPPVYLSVIVPVYNEVGRLGGLATIIEYLKKQAWRSELIAVNDGSTDATARRVKLQCGKKVQIISYPVNRGKGYAVRRGMLAAQGKYRLFVDVDLSTPIETVGQALKLIQKSDVVIGSRRASGAQILVHQSWLREALGRMFTKLSQIVLDVPVSDFTCGFKLFSKEAAQEIFSRSSIRRWGFDSEILFIAKRLGYQIREIPVVWTNDLRTRVKFPQDLIQSLVDLVKIRYTYPRLE